MNGIERAARQAGSIAELGRSVGVRRQVAARWVKRGYAPRHHVERLSRLFGVPKHDLADPALVALFT